MKFFRSKFFIISVAVLLSLTLVTGLLWVLGFSEPIKLVLGTVARPFEYLGARAADAVNGFYEVFADYEELRAENEALRAELESLRNAEHDAEVLRDENEWLKKYIGFATENPSFSLVDATVVARESNGYSYTLTLNRGLIHGVKKDMPVITEDGVYGHVTEIGLDYCRVAAIVSPETRVGAVVTRSGATGVISGELALSPEGYCTMTYIESTADIRIDDRIYTSGGVGSSYPAGLYLGEVVSLDPDESTRTLSAKIKPAVDFTDVNSVTKVMIISGYGEGVAE